MSEIKIKRKWENKDSQMSFPDFFYREVMFPTVPFCRDKRGIEDQMDKLSRLYGALIETLVIRNIINVNDVDRILGPWSGGVEIIEEEI